MASVQSSRSKKYELLTKYGEEQPPVHVESEGEKFIRELSCKQLDTNLTLDKQTKLEKEFERGTGFVPLSAFSGGSCSLKEVKEKVIRTDKLEKLLLLGLNRSEAEAVLNNDDLTFPNRDKVEPSIRLARAQKIKNIIGRINNVNYMKCEKDNNCNAKQKHQFEDSDVISRHDKELALAVKPQSTETKLLLFAIEHGQTINAINSGGKSSNGDDNKKDLRPPEHPINRLHELEDQLFRDYTPQQLIKTIKRKRSQLLESCQPPYGPKYMKVSEPDKKQSLWDQETEQKVENGSKNKETKLYTCIQKICKKEKRLYTIENGKIVELSKKEIKKINNCEENIKGKLEEHKLIESYTSQGTFVNFQSLQKKSCNTNNIQRKLSNEEFKTLLENKFQGYSKGTPSKVLYVKNLRNNVKENDLVNLFKKFEKSEPRIIYKLMNGKMRGQAFITFSNVDAATEALEEINGTLLKDKPVVIQFGRR